MGKQEVKPSPTRGAAVRKIERNRENSKLYMRSLGRSLARVAASARNRRGPNNASSVRRVTGGEPHKHASTASVSELQVSSTARAIPSSQYHSRLPGVVSVQAT